MPKLKLTLEIIYDANPEHYGTNDINKIIEIDTGNVDDYGIDEMIENLLNDNEPNLKFKIEEVKEVE